MIRYQKKNRRISEHISKRAHVSNPEESEILCVERLKAESGGKETTPIKSLVHLKEMIQRPSIDFSLSSARVRPALGFLPTIFPKDVPLHWRNHQFRHHTRSSAKGIFRTLTAVCWNWASFVAPRASSQCTSISCGHEMGTHTRDGDKAGEKRKGDGNTEKLAEIAICEYVEIARKIDNQHIRLDRRGLRERHEVVGKSRHFYLRFSSRTCL